MIVVVLYNENALITLVDSAALLFVIGKGCYGKLLGEGERAFRILFFFPVI
jgi:hypothetical protein